MKMRVMLLSFLGGAALVACERPGPNDGDGEKRAPANTITELPLKRGFYVMNDTACGNASNATLLLIRAGGMNGARDACDFSLIERTGPTSYRAAVACTDIQGGGVETSTYLYEILDSAQFSYGTEGSDYRSHFRYCEQSSLPDPWRDNDISNLIGEGDAQ
jgi:hypothetical protein